MAKSKNEVTKLDKYSIAEIICTVALLVFILVLLVVNSGGTSKTADQVAEPVIKVMDVSKMTKKSASVAATVFDFDRAKAEDIVYYDTGNVMDVSELLIVKLYDEADAKEFKAAADKRVETQKALFKSYAPDQYALLDKSVVEVSGNMLFYCTAENADDVYRAFKKAL
ncbi:MAG: DUF4358 domain-containing protein [Eubacterium sp.]|nr:DUF4358 domain-containing protein [Eubacterium sp.]